MPLKTIEIVGVGPVLISKRRGSKNLRLSINSKGQLKLNMPKWTPYSVGIAFVISRKEWISKHAKSHTRQALVNNDRIGKSFRLKFTDGAPQSEVSARVAKNEILITVPPKASVHSVQEKTIAACERALRRESEALLPIRLEQLAKRHGFSYGSVRIKKLTARWGSCSAKGDISLSYYLVQLPWQFIDYVLLHELVHTKHHNHGSDFWLEFKRVLPEARQLQKQIRSYKPQVQAAI